MNAFCYKNMNVKCFCNMMNFVPIYYSQLFSYVMSVLYPESLIRLIMDYYSISFEEVSVLLRSRSSSILFSSHNR